MRLLKIAIPQLFSAAGITVGSLVYGQGRVTVAALTGVALASGMISSIGAATSVSVLLLLLNPVMGAGLPMPGQWWPAPVLHEVRSDLSGPPGSVLEPLRQEVAAARAITSPL